MPTKTEKQRKLFGMVHAYKKGELKHAYKEVKSIAKGISDKKATEFASNVEHQAKALANSLLEWVESTIVADFLVPKLKTFYVDFYNTVQDELTSQTEVTFSKPSRKYEGDPGSATAFEGTCDVGIIRVDLTNGHFQVKIGNKSPFYATGGAEAARALLALI